MLSSGSSEALSHRVALVTGAAGGIGAAICQVLSAAGAIVIGTDIEDTTDAAESVCREFLRADVTVEDQVRSIVAKVAERHGRLDIVVNSAGVGIVSDRPVPTHMVNYYDWNRTISVNLSGCFLVCRYALPSLMITGGAVVNIASVMGLVGITGGAAYSASKSGILGLTRVMALEYAKYRVRVNAVCPGFIDTPMIRSMLPADDSASKQLAWLESLHPVGRLGIPAEVAQAVHWLVSDSASFVTGATLAVDGGYTSR